MRLLSFAVGDYVSFGAVSGDAIVDVGRLFSERYPTLGSVLRAGELHRAMALGGSSKATIALDEIRYLPPVTDPEKIICIGINYGNRNAEYKDGAEAPQYPSVFMRTPGSLVGHLEPILNPPESNQLDYEGEIVLVIGKGGRRIAAADAWQHVAGLTLMNEGSVRDWLRHSKFNVTPARTSSAPAAWGLGSSRPTSSSPTASCT
jgi:2-keto-4-pentenoate hydratase/2-oxohepta-3-ene-1,7-dioic acid hydratase in catechol pathway